MRLPILDLPAHFFSHCHIPSHSQDLAVGMSIDGVISSVETYGLLVSLSGSVRGLVPTAHMSDLGMASAKKKFKVRTPVRQRASRLSVSGLRVTV